MSALASTGRGSKACRYVASSRLAAFNAHQRGARNRSPLSRGHGAHVCQMQSGFCRVVSPALMLTSLLNWRGLQRSASFSRPHSHRLRSILLPLSRLVAESAFASAPVITNSVRVVGCSRLPAKAVQHEPLVNRTSPAGLIHRRVPSSIASSVKSPWTEGMPTSCQTLPKWSVK